MFFFCHSGARAPGSFRNGPPDPSEAEVAPDDTLVSSAFIQVHWCDPFFLEPGKISSRQKSMATSGRASTGLGLFGGRLSSESLRSLYICIAYGSSSILISLIYKALLRCVQ